MVVIPVLWPSFLGTVILLFANAFGAIATAYALTGSSLNIVPILLYAQIRGDVLHNAASRLCDRLRHDRHHRPRQRLLHLVPDAQRKVAQMRSRAASGPGSPSRVGAAYFFIPLIATLEFSMRMRRGVYSFDAYTVVFGDVRFQQTFGYSVWPRSSPSSSAC